jgi:hypothetical protein
VAEEPQEEGRQEGQEEEKPPLEKGRPLGLGHMEE